VIAVHVQTAIRRHVHLGSVKNSSAGNGAVRETACFKIEELLARAKSQYAMPLFPLKMPPVRPTQMPCGCHECQNIGRILIVSLMCKTEDEGRHGKAIRLHQTIPCLQSSHCQSSIRLRRPTQAIWNSVCGQRYLIVSRHLPLIKMR
jgi:hypothetical protein